MSTVSTHNDVYQLSAAYVQDALEGRHHASGRGRILESGGRGSLWSLGVTSSWAWHLLLLATVLCHCMQVQYEPSRTIVRAAALDTAPLALGILCVVIYTADNVMHVKYMTLRQYLRFRHNRGLLILNIILVLDYLIYCRINPKSLNSFSGRLIFRCLRPFFWLLRDSTTRSTGAVMLGIIPTFLKFMMPLFLFIAMFATIGCHLFSDVYGNGANFDLITVENGMYNGSFNNALLGSLRVFVLMTSGSYPRIAIPAYRRHSTHIAFFGLLKFTGMFIVIGTLVAKIYDSYKKANKIRIKQERFQERECLVKAFVLIDVQEEGCISLGQWKRLYRLLKPKELEANAGNTFIKFKELAGETGEPTTLSMVEFLALPDVIHTHFQQEQAWTDDTLGQNEESTIASVIKAALANNLLTGFFIGCHAAYLLLTCLVWYRMQAWVLWTVFGFEWVLLIIFIIETMLKVAAHKRLFLSIKNITDSAMLVVALVIHIYLSAASSVTLLRRYPRIICKLAVAIKLMLSNKYTLALVDSCRKLAHPFGVLTSLAGVFSFCWAVVGMELYSDLGPSSRSVMCGYGFDSLACAMLTMFHIVVGVSWHKQLNNLIHATSAWAGLYYVIYYVTMELLIVNVFVAIIVNLSTLMKAEVERNNFIESRAYDAMSSPATPLTPDPVRQCAGANPSPFPTQRRPGSIDRQHSQSSATPNHLTIDGGATFQLTPKKGQRNFRNWRREIVSQDMTVLNANELIRLSEMGKHTLKIREQTKMLQRQKLSRQNQRKTIQVRSAAVNCDDNLPSGASGASQVTMTSFSQGAQ